MFGRAQTGSQATIQETAHNQRWFKILLEDGREAWIIKKYIERVVESTTPVSGETADDEWAVWSSLEECQEVVRTGRRMASQTPNALRVATWNIRWFPDGEMHSNHRNQTEPTDLGWLVCTIVWMNLDILALQEIRTTNRADEAWEVIIDSLNSETGGDWRLDFQECGGRRDQHVGFLWNASNVSLSNHQSVWQLNGKAQNGSNPCFSRNRPGRYALVQRPNGPDFHIITVHSKSSTNSSSMATRQTSLDRIDDAVRPFLPADNDVIILGDFNTMGSGTDQSLIEELEDFSTRIAGDPPRFSQLQLEPQCTEYYDGHAGLLDHVIFNQTMIEISVNSGRVTGYCAIANCERFGQTTPSAYQNLSDHCPVVFEVANQDED